MLFSDTVHDKYNTTAEISKNKMWKIQTKVLKNSYVDSGNRAAVIKMKTLHIIENIYSTKSD